MDFVDSVDFIYFVSFVNSVHFVDLRFRQYHRFRPSPRTQIGTSFPWRKFAWSSFDLLIRPVLESKTMWAPRISANCRPFEALSSPRSYRNWKIRRRRNFYVPALKIEEKIDDAVSVFWFWIHSIYDRVSTSTSLVYFVNRVDCRVVLFCCPSGADNVPFIWF